MSVYALLPAFNEADKIGRLLDEMPSHVDGVDLRIVVIDDGSDDGTADVVRGSGVDLVRFDQNQGKGAALCRGVEEIRGLPLDALLWMDTDGQHPVSSIANLVRPVLQGSADLCVGSRYLADRQSSHAPLNRRLVRSMVVRAVRRRTGIPVSDPFSGFRCFSPAAVESLRLVGCGYESELESMFSVARAGLSYQEVSIPRIYGSDTSKMGFVHGAFKGRLRVLSGYTRTIMRDRMGWFAQSRIPSNG